jgi:hypothetical protein
MSTRNSSQALSAAALGAALMMAHHVGAKSVRDALFLSSFSVSALPVMVMCAAGFSLLLAVGASRVMHRYSPAVVAPRAFAAVAVLYALAGLLLLSQPRPAAVLIFLLAAGTGTLLTSGFWSLLSECLDPNMIRAHVGRIAAAGTAGVVAGGLLAERAGAFGSVTAMLPVLVLLHLLCGVAAARLARLAPEQAKPDEPGSESARRLPLRQVLAGAPYLLPLGLLVLTGTTAAGLIDYVFKAQSAAEFASREDLLRFFAVFHAGIGLVTFVLQSGFSRWLLARSGIGRTLATLPAATAFGAFAAMILPGLPSVGLARGFESVFRGSFFRAGYELFYAPVPAGAKRAAKPLIDAGFDRLGDGLAGALVRFLLLSLPAFASQAILTVAVLLGIAGIWLALRLEAAYVEVLESDLLRRARDLELGEFSGSIYASMTFAQLPLDSGEAVAQPMGSIEALRELTSGDPQRAGRILLEDARLDALLVPATIALLASGQLHRPAIRALRTIAEEHTGQLLDHLLSPADAVAVRRRIPRILAHCRGQRAVDGLLQGLDDPDFEVRYRCAQALASIASADGALNLASHRIHAAILRETGRGSGAWVESQIVDAVPDEDLPGAIAGPLEGVSSLSLEYVFTLLSLVLPRHPLRVAYHGLHAGDPHLRGTALEYLESVLPQEIQRALWPLIAEGPLPGGQRPARPGAEVEEELLRAEPSILLNLEERQRGQ